MARKQSRASWRKRGAALEEGALSRRREENAERRTGGALSHLPDHLLFSLSALPSSLAPSLPSSLAPRSPRALHVDRVVAANPNVPKVASDPTLPTTPSLPTNLKAKLSKLAKRAKTAPPRSPSPSSPQLDIWAGEGRDGAIRRRLLPPERSTTSAPVPLAEDGLSWNPEESARVKRVEEALSHEVKRRRKERMGRSRAFTHAPDSDDEEGGEGEWRGGGEASLGVIEMPVDRTPRDHTLMGGVVDTREDEEYEEGEGEGGDSLPRSAARTEPLTAAQRRRRKLAQERAKAEAEAKKERRAAKQLGRESALLAEIKKSKKALEAKRAAEAEREVSQTLSLTTIVIAPPSPHYHPHPLCSPRPS